jgi:hypothetical protein
MAATPKFNSSHNQLLLSEAQKLTEENRTKRVSPILEKSEDLQWQDDSGSVQARKCKCGLVWCGQCSKGKWAKKHGEELTAFDWKRTREVIVGIERERFEDGEAAWRYVLEHKMIPGFIRNLERGKKEKRGEKWAVKFKPVKIKNWKWFLEWHKDGYPHWHIFIEVESEGSAGQIGGDMLRHYWPIAKWVKEHFFKSGVHWRNQVGYFEKNGYFHKNKKHQTKLPEWAMDRAGLRVRRSGGKNQKEESDLVRLCDYFRRRTQEVVDTRTGEIVKYKAPGDEKAKKTYGERLKQCGHKTWMRIVTGRETIQGIFDIPYNEIRRNYEGEYSEGVGYIFKATREVIEKFIIKCVKPEEYERKRACYWKRERKGFLDWKWCLKVEPVVVHGVN